MTDTIWSLVMEHKKLRKNDCEKLNNYKFVYTFNLAYINYYSIFKKMVLGFKNSFEINKKYKKPRCLLTYPVLLIA